MRLKRLYSEPDLFDAITFESGVNVILGDKGDATKRTNSVGKSVCIELLNFCLLKGYSESRVARIPEMVLPLDTLICLDMQVDDSTLTVKRSARHEHAPIIIVNGMSQTFSSIEDARSFVLAKVAKTAFDSSMSFRSLFSILTRDERSEFKEIDRPFDTKLRAPPDLIPHLYLLGLDISLFRESLKLSETLKKAGAGISQVKKDLKRMFQTTPAAARSQINALTGELKAIERGLEQLESVPGFEAVRKDAERIEERMDTIRIELRSTHEQLRRLKPIEQSVDLQDDEVVEFYNGVSQRLGDIVRRDLQEALEFKRKIVQYQSKIVSKRRDDLASKIAQLKGQLEEQDRLYKPIADLLQKSGRLAGIRQSYAAHNQKEASAGELRAFTSQHERLTSEKTALQLEIAQKNVEIERDVAVHADNLTAFEKTFLDIHEEVQGNRNAHLRLAIGAGKPPVKLDCRIDSDGGHSHNRQAVFIYDMALLFSALTSTRHPGVLVHDNIFASDNETLSRNMEFIRKSFEVNPDRQYILTLNTDLVSSLSPVDAGYLSSRVKAKYTREARFLRCEYQEKAPAKRRKPSRQATA